jgi:hypothetical protein
MLKRIVPGTCLLLFLPSLGFASSGSFDWVSTHPRDPWGALFTSTAISGQPPTVHEIAVVAPPLAAAEQTPAPRVRTVEYSDAYRTRAKIHKIASYAMLPLFVSEWALGQSMYNNPDESKKGAHAALGASIGVLFGVNTVTGAWNMWEARKDTNGRTRRMVHGLLMMAADVGFVATAALAPDLEGEFEHGGGDSGSGSKSTHRAVALTSMGLATVGYLVMLFGG